MDGSIRFRAVIDDFIVLIQEWTNGIVRVLSVPNLRKDGLLCFSF